MIKEYPLGIGKEKFDFYQVPYAKDYLNETRIAINPHNEFLKYSIEEGLIFSILCVVAILCFIYYNRIRLFDTLKNNSGSRYAFSLLAFFVVESLFQFPLDLAYPILIISIALGFVLAQIYQPNSYAFSWYAKTPILLFLGYLFFGYVYGKFVEAFSAYDTQKLTKACTLDPANKKVCAFEINNLINESYLLTALDKIKLAQKKDPYSFINLRALGRIYATLGIQNKSCESSVLYNSLFKNNQSFLSEFVIHNCLEFKPPISHSPELIKAKFHKLFSKAELENLKKEIIASGLSKEKHVTD